MYDLISIGNISIDMYYKGESLTYEDGRFQLAIGGKYFVEAFHQSVGGGGANVAIGAQHNGIKTAVIGLIGNNAYKNMILADLRDAGVHTAFCQMEEEFLNISSILLTSEGERTVINFSTQHMKLFEDEEEQNLLLHAKHVYLGNLPDVSFTQREEILHFLKRNNIKTIVNLGVKDCRRPLSQIEKFLKPVDVVIMNGYEFAETIKRDYSSLSFANNPVKDIEYLRDKVVIVTDGKKGSHGYLNNEYYYQEAVPVHKIMDTTGAGDGYTAAFIATYILTGDIKHAMNKGAHYAVKILGKLGAN